jgi:hypothetical protein
MRYIGGPAWPLTPARALVLVLWAAPAAAQSRAPLGGDSPDAVRLRRIAASPLLDGVPDEPMWLAADSVTEFTQRDPDEGRPASERTVVRLLATEEGLWVGVWAYDRTPERIRRTQLRRDFDPDPDDVFCVVLDPQRDRRSGVLFCVNPNGAQLDGEIRSAEDADDNWNGVWDARARVGAWGWSAELLIPWQTLRYRRGEDSWGLNLARVIRHRNEEVEWRAWRRHQGLFFLEEAGRLTGLGELPRRGLLEARPYASATGQAASHDLDSLPSDTAPVYRRLDAATGEAKLGFDGKLALAPTLTLDFTVNTDFAQVEADRQVVNLTRFPLFFPEKRPFFLEAADQFEFGQQERLQVFYSRRIGLGPEGEPIPIVAGARVTGRVGRERIGLLALRTGGDEDAVDVVARIKHDIFSRGFVGAIVTAQGGPGVPDTRRAAGVDLEVPTLLGGQNLVFAAFAASTWNGEGASRRTAWRVFVDYPNDWADNFLSVGRIEDGFDPALGFVRQSGVWRYIAAFRFFPRPRNSLGIRRLSLMPIRLDLTTDLDGELDNANYEIRPLGAEFQGGDEIELNLQRYQDAPRDSFEIFPGTVIQAGRYTWDRVELVVRTSPGRTLGFQLEADAGEYYSGTGVGLEAGFDLRVAPRLLANLELERQAARLAGGRFTVYAARLRLDYATSPRLNTTMFLQYDNESDRLAVNLRLHWIPRPGSDAYLVWNSAWPTALTGGVPWRRPLQGGLVGKIVWYFRV